MFQSKLPRLARASVISINELATLSRLNLLRNSKYSLRMATVYLSLFSLLSKDETTDTARDASVTWTTAPL